MSSPDACTEFTGNTLSSAGLSVEVYSEAFQPKQPHYRSRQIGCQQQLYHLDITFFFHNLIPQLRVTLRFQSFWQFAKFPLVIEHDFLICIRDKC